MFKTMHTQSGGWPAMDVDMRNRRLLNYGTSEAATLFPEESVHVNRATAIFSQAVTADGAISEERDIGLFSGRALSQDETPRNQQEAKMLRSQMDFRQTAALS